MVTALTGTDEARSRLMSELVREDPRPGLYEMVEDGFFDSWIPEVVEMRMEQDPVHRHKDVLTHTFAVTSAVPAQFRLRLAALLHDVGKPATRRIGPDGVTFRHHEAVGARITRRRLGAMEFDAEFVADVARLVELSGRVKGFDRGWTDAAVRRYAVDAGALLGDLNLLVRCDCTTRNARRAAALQELVDELELRIRRLAAADAESRRRPVLSGDEIMEVLGIPPGPAVGAARRMLMEIDQALDHDEVVQMLRCWWAGRVESQRCADEA